MAPLITDVADDGQSARVQLAVGWVFVIASALLGVLWFGGLYGTRWTGAFTEGWNLLFGAAVFAALAGLAVLALSARLTAWARIVAGALSLALALVALGLVVPVAAGLISLFARNPAWVFNASGSRAVLLIPYNRTWFEPTCWGLAEIELGGRFAKRGVTHEFVTCGQSPAVRFVDDGTVRVGRKTVTLS